MDNYSAASVQSELNEEALFRNEKSIEDLQAINEAFAEEERWYNEQERQFMLQLEYRLNEQNYALTDEIAAYNVLQDYYGKDIAQNYADILGKNLERIPEDVMNEVAATQTRFSRLEQKIQHDVKARRTGKTAEYSDREKIRNQLKSAERTNINVFIYDDKPDRAYVDVVMHYPDREPELAHVTVPINLDELARNGVTPNVGMEQYIKEQIEKGNISEIRSESMIQSHLQARASRSEPLRLSNAKKGRAATYPEKRYLARQTMHHPDAAVNITANGNKAYVDLQYPSPATGQPEMTHVTVKLDQSEMDRRGITQKNDDFKKYVTQQIKEGCVTEIRSTSLDPKFNHQEENTMQESMVQLLQDQVNFSEHTR